MPSNIADAHCSIQVVGSVKHHFIPLRVNSERVILENHVIVISSVQGNSHHLGLLPPVRRTEPEIGLPFCFKRVLVSLGRRCVSNSSTHHCPRCHSAVSFNSRFATSSKSFTSFVNCLKAPKVCDISSLNPVESPWSSTFIRLFSIGIIRSFK